MDRAYFLENFKKKKLERGENIYLNQENVLAVHWYVKYEVFALSIIQSTSSTENQRKRADDSFLLKQAIINVWAILITEVKKT